MMTRLDYGEKKNKRGEGIRWLLGRQGFILPTRLRGRPAADDVC
jgi:hypothetical protein